MSTDVPLSALTSEELRRLSLFDKELADSLDTALASVGSEVTFAEIQDIAQGTYLGRLAGAGTGVITAMTATQATAGLNAFTSLLAGLAPASGGGTTAFLRADATWATPPGSTPFDTHDIYLTYSADRTGATDATTAIQSAIDAAETAYTSSGRVQTVYIPAGNYKLTARVDVNQFDLDGTEGINFVGDGIGRSRIHQSANAASANWHMFRIRGGASNIGFHGLTLTQTGSTNMPEQSHILHPGEDCSDIRIWDCEIGPTIAGDGIRVLGDSNGQGSVTDLSIIRCQFVDCVRAGVSFQRYAQDVTIAACHFTGGTDQQIDFEPTGGTFVADAGSGATTIVDAAANFTLMGIVAGDKIYNQTENKAVHVVSVDSATQLTVTAGCTSFVGDTYAFAKRLKGIQIIGNRLVRGSNTAQILMTLNGDDIIVQGNYIEGAIFGLYLNDSQIVGNIIDDPIATSLDSHASINFIKGNGNLTIADNYIKNGGNSTDFGKAIQISHQSSEQPDSVAIHDNTIYLTQKGTGINCAGVANPTVMGNTLVHNVPGSTGDSAGIVVASASGMTVARAVVLNNVMRAIGGTWDKGIKISASTNAVTSCIIGGGSIDNAVEHIDLPETAGGTFTNPPVLVPILCDAGQITEPPSLPWIQLAGIGGSAVTTNSRKPAVFWGTGDPDTVLTAGLGSTAQRRDTGDWYRKLKNTTATGWHSPTAATTTTSGNLTVSSGKTNLSVTGTQSYTLPDGYASGQKMTVVCTVAASTPKGTLTVTTPFSGDPSTYLFTTVGQRLDFEWTGTTWRCLAKLRVGSQTPVLGTDAVSSMVAVVNLSVTGTVSGALPNGAIPGELLEVRCTTAGGIPAGSLTGTYKSLAAAATTSAAFDSTADYFVALWNGSAWLVTDSNSVTFT